VLDFQGLNLSYDEEMVRVAPDYLLEFAKAIDRPDADALFISCGALRTVDVIQAIEDALGKPAICSNQANALALPAPRWHRRSHLWSRAPDVALSRGAGTPWFHAPAWSADRRVSANMDL
jgi:hypothetical protein